MRASSLFIPRPLLVLALTLPLAACSGVDERPVAIVPDLELGPPTMRFGSLDDEATALVPVRALTLDADGVVWLTQSQDGEVLALSPSGAVSRRLGGLGEGPGEYGSVDALGWVGDTLWVSDLQLRRVTLYDMGGTGLGTLPIAPLAMGEERSASFSALVQGGALYTTAPALGGVGPDAFPQQGVDSLRVAPRSGGSSRAIATRSATRARALVINAVGGEVRAIQVFVQPWSDGSLHAVTPGGEGLVVVDREVDPDQTTPQYRVTRLTLAGDTLWSTPRGYTPHPLDPAYRDSVLTTYAREPFDLDEVRAAVFTPPTLPPVTSIFAARDGRVWVGREHAVGATEWRWDVFDAAGRLERSVVGPAQVVLLAAHRNVVWGVETDPFDVSYVVRYSLPSS